MNNILYILGAGFSAPLGLPVISNFLELSKNLYEKDPEKYAHFREIYNRLDRMGKAKNYFNCDLFNIEEILSIIEMESFITGKDSSKDFGRYIADVVEHYTPDLVPEKKRNEGHTWFPFMFSPKSGNARLVAQYYQFAATLFNLVFERDPTTLAVSCSASKTPNARYGVITLNYDMVLESIVERINSDFSPAGKLVVDYGIQSQKPYDIPYHVPLAKLHGSIRPLTIIPPTWNKSRNPQIANAWVLAEKLISQANCIRFIGYSLPLTDNYVRYLLIAGILNSLNLKRIEVICMNNNHEVQRYKSLFNFTNLHFLHEQVQNFFSTFCISPDSGSSNEVYPSGRLEK